jgi:hypothetical protein
MSAKRLGNLVPEGNWEGTDGEFALLTSLFYTWNPTLGWPWTDRLPLENDSGDAAAPSRGLSGGPVPRLVAPSRSRPRTPAARTSPRRGGRAAPTSGWP